MAATYLSDDVFRLSREDGWRLPDMRATGIRHVSSGGGAVSVCTSDGRIVRWRRERRSDDGDYEPDSPPEIIEFEKKGPDARVHNVFIDPTGFHVIISTVWAGTAVTYYAPSRSRATTAGVGRIPAKELSGLKGVLIESVAWNCGGVADESRTGSFLVGTANGRVYEVKIEDKRQTACEKVWELPESYSQPIVGLTLQQYSPSKAGTRYLALVVTADPLRIYQFSGGPTISAMFTTSSSKSLLFQEIKGPSGAAVLDFPELVLFVTSPLAATAFLSSGRQTDNLQADAFALLTPVGVYTGHLNLSSAASEGASPALVDTTIVSYPTVLASGAVSGGGGGKASGRGGMRAVGGLTLESTTLPTTLSSSNELPIALAVTDYHVLLLYKHRLVALSRVTFAVVYELALPEERYGVLKGMSVDSGYNSSPRSRRSLLTSIWVYSDKQMYELLVKDEEAEVWRLYLLKKNFESALRLVGTDRKRQELVRAAQAQHHMDNGHFDDAADAWVFTSVPFEEVCLKFIHTGATSALQKYVGCKLDTLGVGEGVKIQRTILSTWLTEMYLNHLNILQQPSLASGSLASPAYDKCVSEFRAFLSLHLSSLDKPTTLALLASHGRTEELLYYCELTQDYDRVVSHHVQNGDYRAALDALRSVPLPSHEELWYRYSPVLMQHIPRLCVEGWKETVANDTEDTGGLTPVKLIPAMVRYEQTRTAVSTAVSRVVEPPAAGRGNPFAPLPATGSSSMVAVAATTGSRGNPFAPTGSVAALGPDFTDLAADYVLHYLEWVVNHEGRGSREKAVHNFLLSLYAKQPVEDILLGYIALQTAGMSQDVLSSAARRPPTHSSTASGGLGLGLGDDFDVSLPGVDGLGSEKKGGGGGEEDGGEASGPLFDLQYALRLCLGEGKSRACVQLYTAMGLFEEAVDLALKTASLSSQSGGHALASELNETLQVAKDAANACAPGDRDRRKKLWMRVAAWVVSHGGGVPQALKLLKESEEVLRVEDLLVYFPDVTLIDDFKSEISTSLHECHRGIAALQKEMRGYQEAAEKIRNDIRGLRNRCGYVRVGQKCDLCGRLVLSTHFYLFSCSHAFHRDCLTKEMGHHLLPPIRKKVEKVSSDLANCQGAITALGGVSSVEVGGGGDGKGARKGGSAALSAATASPAELIAALVRRRDTLQAELDRHVANECLYCGEIMIDSVADPLTVLGLGMYSSTLVEDDWDL